MSYWKNIAPLCDFFFTIQRGEFSERLKEIGVSNFYYLPLGCDPEVHKKLSSRNKKYDCDVSFMGAGYYNRRHSMQRLLDFDLKIWGNEWDVNTPLGRCIQAEGKRIEPKEYNKIFNSSKINLNLHSSTYHQGVNPFGDFVNPRTFEIASAGGFQLVDYRSELPRVFKPNEEIVCYRDIDELREKIKYYLKYPDKRKIIARRGRKRALKEHTYENRMKEMIAFILEIAPDKFYTNKKIEKKIGQSLVEQAGKNTELGIFLSRFKDKNEIDIKDIVNEIKHGEGSLSKTENLFLFMESLTH
jgi:spore maturation protein CgeB